MRGRFNGLWRHPDFLRLWAGETISVFGSFVGGLALSFTAVVYLHADALQVALVAASNTASGVCVGLFAGVWVDRLQRRHIMITADLGRAVLLGTIPLAAALGALRVEQLYVVGFLVGALTTFFDVAYQSYLPTLVRQEELLEGNSKLTATASVAEFGGFSLAGWLVQLLSGPGAIAIDAVSFVVSAGAVATIRTPESVSSRARQSVRDEIVDGIRSLLHDRVLRALAASAISLQFASGMIGAVYLLFASRELGFSPGTLGMIFAVGGVMSLFGALLAGWAARRFGIAWAMIAGLTIAGLGVLIVVGARGATLLSAGLLLGNQLITDGAWTIYEINATSLRQTITPDQMRGRVNAAIRFGGLVAMLVGAIVAGLAANAAGTRVVLLAGGCVLSSSALWLLFSPVRSRHGPDAELISVPLA